ncbi:MAG: hypothetical protein RMJ13_02640 [Elusimicrobiota bacterium]|nr:hypothetical protein [Elusimicrobiota bacterium]
MRKYIRLLALCMLVLTSAGIIYAQTATDHCYVIVRCTVTISINIDDTASLVHLSTAGPNVFVVSGSSYVTVTNNSSGAICKWRVRVSTQEYTTQDPPSGGWTVPTTGDYYWNLRENGQSAAGDVMTAALLCIFASSATTSCVSTDFDTDNASDDIIGYSWVILEGAKMKHNSSIPPDDWPSGGTNADIAAGGIRNLFFGIRYPSAVADEFYRRFTVEVNAALPGTAW